MHTVRKSMGIKGFWKCLREVTFSGFHFIFINNFWQVDNLLTNFETDYVDNFLTGQWIFDYDCFNPNMGRDKTYQELPTVVTTINSESLTLSKRKKIIEKKCGASLHQQKTMRKCVSGNWVFGMSRLWMRGIKWKAQVWKYEGLITSLTFLPLNY